MRLSTNLPQQYSLKLYQNTGGTFDENIASMLDLLTIKFFLKHLEVPDG